MLKYDVAIIGAGAVGCAVAKVLSEYELKACVIEKEADAAFGTSGRNSGVVHAGFNNEAGSFKARFCVEGSHGFEKLAEELGIKYRKTGKLVTGFYDDDRKKIEELKQRGEANGVLGLRIIEQAEIKAINPNIRGNFALLSEQTAIFDPFEYTIALAETASANGVDFYFGCKVSDISKKKPGSYEKFELECEFCEPENVKKFNCIAYEDGKLTSKLHICAELIINCAGLYSADICKMLGIDRYEIRPCRGEYHILGKSVSQLIDMPIYPVPDEKNGVLGVHLTPTVKGNVMIGPSAEFLKEKDDYSNDENIIEVLSKGAEQLIPEIRKMEIIRSFSGIRPKLIDRKGEIKGDFVIKEADECKGFIFLVGIESPGITASFPIAEYVRELAEKSMGISFIRKTEIKKRDVIFCQNADDMKEYSEFKKMVCRCERVDEGNILRAYDNILKLGAIPTIKGIKNRTRAFMGGCQGCFCTIDTVELLKEKRGVDIADLTYSGVGSEMFAGNLK